MSNKIQGVVVLLAIASVVLGGCLKLKPELKSPFTWRPNEINGPLPDNWSWGNANGINYLCTTKNQHIPQYCGSCWAQSTTSTISDRIAIARGGKFPEIDISPQVLLTCDLDDDGCHGGEPLSAYQWMHNNDITDSSCAPYLALSHYEGLKCDSMSLCKDCAPSGTCITPPTYNKYRVGEYGSLPQDPVAIQNEIFARGPVTCCLNAGPIKDFTGTGVFASNDVPDLNHAIAVVGWGVTTDGKKTPYWIVRNSWGEYYDDMGYIKIFRGNNTIGIEMACTYGVPLNTWDKQPYPHTSKAGLVDGTPQKKIESLNDLFSQYLTFKKLSFHKNGLIENPNPTRVVLTPQPADSVMALPDSFWWGNANGVNYLSWVVNQHIPQYCGSCWAQAASSSLADRINILSAMKFPRTTLAVQVLINCKAGGSCNGGSMDGPFQFAHKHGIPDMGCQVYEAKNPSQFSCSDIQTCKNCKWNPDFSQNCWAVNSYPKWYVKEYGSVRGPDAMKKELLARGPMSCQIMVTNNFENYVGGIYSEKTLFNRPNHAISVVGWGKDATTGTEYWIVRNSWGTHFGENGYFRIQMYHENLGIDSYDCWWGVPSQTPTFEAETA